MPDILISISMGDLLSKFLSCAGQCAQDQYKNRKAGKMIVLVIPAQGFKTTLCQELQTQDSDNYNIFAIENIAKSSMSEEDRTALDKYKESSLLYYEKHLSDAVCHNIEMIREHLYQTRDFKDQIYLVSSLNMKRLIAVQGALSYYYVPAKSLSDTIMEKFKDSPAIMNFIQKTKKSIVKGEKNPQVYRNFEELANIVMADLGISTRI